MFVGMEELRRVWEVGEALYRTRDGPRIRTDRNTAHMARPRMRSQVGREVLDDV